MNSGISRILFKAKALMLKTRHNLLPQSTSFVGRESEVATISELLVNETCRLVSLVGPGGIGKTRLGIEVAERFVKSEANARTNTFSPSSVYLVPLQAVAATDNVLPAVANAMGFEFYEARSPERQLINYIGDRQILLILDNMEHLLDAGDLIDALLSNTPGLKLLITSREPLNLSQEWLFHVEGLSIPSLVDETSDDFDAVQLFIERARRVRYSFSTDDDQACVVRLCQLVDGMPLALELSAVWLKRLSCHEIVSEIQRSLNILKTDMRGVPDRHRSIRLVFDYSWQMLGQEERELFMKLSVFRGGFLREAAEQIAGSTLQSLSNLVDKSMVVAHRNGRYQIHELQRQYGREKLSKVPEIETAVRDRHCQYFTAFMDRPFGDYYGFGSKEMLKEIDADIDNVQVAWDWAVAGGRFRDLHHCIIGLYHYSFLRFWTQGIDKAFYDAEIALRRAESGLDRDVTLGLLLAMGSSADLWMGRPQRGKERAEESVTILEPLDAPRELAAAYVSLVWVARFDRGRDPDETIGMMLKAAEQVEESGQYGLLGFVYGTIAGFFYDIGRYRESELWDLKGLELSRSYGDPRGESGELRHLGRQALTFGQYTKAREYLKKSLRIARELEASVLITSALNLLGQVAAAMGDLALAEQYIQESLDIASEWGKSYEIAYSLICLAHVNVAKQEFEIAVDQYQEATHFLGNVRSLQAERLWGLGRLAFWKTRYAEAQQLHEESLEICRENNYRLQAVKNEDALGRVDLANSFISAATTHFRAALRESIAIGVPPMILDSLISVAELLVHEGDGAAASDLAQSVANHAASQAESRERANRLIRQIYVDVSIKNMEATGMHQDESDLRSVAASLLERLSTSETSTLSTKVTPSQTLIDPLTVRELELLRLVAEGKSNREIAAELFLALGTVKSHLHNIFQKLHAGSRTQAIVRARELDLL